MLMNLYTRTYAAGVMHRFIYPCVDAETRPLLPVKYKEAYCTTACLIYTHFMILLQL